MAEYDSYEDTCCHIGRVRGLLANAISNLEYRANHHDESKLESPEKEIFDVVTPRLKGLTYGSDEYRTQLKEMGVALEHHYRCNANHHPEGNPDGVNGMSLLDLLETLVDWRAATERHADGSLSKSLVINKTRFKIDDQLAHVLLNTAIELKILDVPKEEPKNKTCETCVGCELDEGVTSCDKHITREEKMETSNMLPWQQRVVEEAKELDAKVEKLQSFINDCDVTHPLPAVELDDLRMQLCLMQGYSETLHRRIGRFEQPKPIETCIVCEQRDSLRTELTAATANLAEAYKVLSKVSQERDTYKKGYEQTVERLVEMKGELHTLKSASKGEVSP